jgi:uncharacterized protein YhaN
MNIDRLDLIAYGHLTDITIDLSARPHRFHIVVGNNESGKSTSMRAIDAWLYGFPGQTSDDYLHRMNKLRVGGVLRVGDQTLECVRRKGNRNTLLAGSDGETPIDEQRLTALLGGVDQRTFGSQFLIDHQELIAGGKLILAGQGELGEVLFAAGAGLGRLRKIQDQLKADEESLLKRQGRSKIADALKTIKQLRVELKVTQIPPADYAQLQTEYSDKQAQLDERKRQRESLSMQRALLTAQLEALPLISDWRHATDELQPLIDVPLLADDFADRRRELTASMTTIHSDLQRLKKDRQRLIEQLKSLQVDAAVLQNSSEIAAIVKQLPVREKAEADRTGYMLDVLNSQQRDLRQQLAELANIARKEVTTDIASDDQLSETLNQFQLNETQRGTLGRLATRFAKLETTHDQTSRDVQRLRKRVETTSAELAALCTTDDARGLTLVLEQLDSPTVLAAACREATEQRDRQLHRCQAIQRRLGVEGALQEVLAIQLPDPAVVTRLARLIDQCEQDLQIATQQLNDLQTQLADQEAEYQASDSNRSIPTGAELLEARRKRDEILDRLVRRSGVVAGSGPLSDDDRADFVFDDMMKSVRRADEIVDQLRLHQQEVANREASLANLRRLSAKVSQATQQVEVRRESRQHAHQEWQRIWSTIGVTAGSPEAMNSWRDEFAKLRDQAEALADSEAALGRTRNAIAAAITRLRMTLSDDDKALVSTATDVDSIQTLHGLYDAAKNAAERYQQQCSSRESLQQQLVTWKSDLEAAESLLAEQTAALRSWQSQWDAATASLSSASPTPDAVVPMLDAINQLNSLQKERADMMHRRTSIAGETAAFLKSAARLIVSIDGPDFAPATEGEETHLLLQRIAPKIEELRQRAARAASDLTTQQRLTERLEEIEQELQQQSSRLQGQQSLLADLCREAFCEHVDQLPDIESRARKRQALAAKVQSTEQQLQRLASPQSVVEFIDTTADLQPGMLEDRLADVDRCRNQLDTQIEQWMRELGALEARIRQIDGRETAADLAQHIATEMGLLREHAEEYIRLRLAGGILRAAIEHYRNENQEPVLQIANDYFSQLTCGSYTGIKVDYDDHGKPILFGARDGLDDVPVAGMSKGTADALYLALRLASLKHRCQRDQPMPLIVDDCLQQLDDQRAAAALQVFAQLSIDTQIILFTHHHHLVAVAEQQLAADQFHVHRL